MGGLFSSSSLSSNLLDFEDEDDLMSRDELIAARVFRR